MNQLKIYLGLAFVLWTGFVFAQDSNTAAPDLETTEPEFGIVPENPENGALKNPANQSNVQAPAVVVPEIAPIPGAPKVQPSASLSELDFILAKERLRKIYGEFNLRGIGDWNVSSHGQTQVWKLTSEGWRCPKEPIAPCADWTPTVFHWWVMNKGWLESWKAESREGFDVIKGRVAPATDSTAEKKDTTAAEEDTVEKLPAEFSGTRLASEVWTWKSTNDVRARLYISLRNQWIDRVESGDSQEYLEWTLRTGKTIPDLTRVIMVKGDTRVSFTKTGK